MQPIKRVIKVVLAKLPENREFQVNAGEGLYRDCEPGKVDGSTTPPIDVI